MANALFLNYRNTRVHLLSSGARHFLGSIFVVGKCTHAGEFSQSDGKCMGDSDLAGRMVLIFFFGRKILTWLLGARMFGRYSNVRRVGNLGVFIFSSALVLSSITGNHRMNDELGSFSAEEK